MSVLHGCMQGKKDFVVSEKGRKIGMDALILQPCISDTAKRRRSSSPESDFFSVANEGDDK